MGWKGTAIRCFVAFGVIALGAVLLVGFAQIPLAWAASIPGFQGNASMIDTSTILPDGTTDFAVFSPGSTPSGLGTFVGGTGSGAWLGGTAGNYEYFYQPVN